MINNYPYSILKTTNNTETQSLVLPYFVKLTQIDFDFLEIHLQIGQFDLEGREVVGKVEVQTFLG